MLSDDYSYGYDAALLFFTYRGKVVRALATNPPIPHEQESRKWGAGVRVVATSAPGTYHHMLRLRAS